MRKLVTSDEMKEIERKTFDLGIPSIAVMENAAAHVADFVKSRFDKANKICVVCGKGNNGGDGFAAARMLFLCGYDVEIFNVFSEINTEEAKINLQAAKKAGVPVVQGQMPQADIIIDAVLGIGIKGGCDLDIIDEINKSGAYVISVDVPSGICADTGAVTGKAVKADATITFGYIKTGLTQYPAKSFAGEIILAQLGFIDDNTKCFYPDIDDIAGMIPDISGGAHKGSMGRLGVIAGSRGMTGAAAMCAMGALRSGAGLVSLVIPENLNSIMEVKLTEAMTVPAGCENELEFDAAVAAIDAVLADAYVLGPGLGKGKDIYKITEYILKKEVPVIIDADGINALNQNIDILKQSVCDVVLTPHPGEFARLLGLSTEDVQRDRINLARKFAVEYGATLVLKGAGTVTALPNGEVYVNSTGNPGMATGGSGDVLAGIVGAFLARGISAEKAAVSAVYVHGLAGDIACEKIGAYGMLPEDTANAIAAAMQRIKNPEL